MGEVDDESEEQEEHDLFDKLLVVFLDADKVKIDHVLQSNGKSQQKLQRVLILTPVFGDLMTVRARLLFYVMLVCEVELVQDH